MQYAKNRDRKEKHTIPAGDFKQQEDLKMYGQLPDYDGFRGYDLGIDSGLGRVDGKIYSNFHMPSWRTLKRHLFLAGGPGRGDYFDISKSYREMVRKTNLSKKERLGAQQQFRLQTRLMNW